MKNNFENNKSVHSSSIEGEQKEVTNSIDSNRRRFMLGVTANAALLAVGACGGGGGSASANSGGSNAPTVTNNLTQSFNIAISFGEANNLQSAVVAEQVYSGMSVGLGSATQTRWRCEPISVPAYERISGIESATGNNITYHIFPGLDSNDRVDVWIIAEAAYDAAGTWSGPAPRTSSNREYGKTRLSITINGVAQTLWDGTSTYDCEFQRMTVMRFQTAELAWGLTNSHISGLITAGKVMPHKSQSLIFSLPPSTITNQTTYKPFKQFGSLAVNAYVGDQLRSTAIPGERSSIGLVHEAFARLVAEVGTHNNEAFVTTSFEKYLRNLAESAGQMPIYHLSTSTHKVADPGNDAYGPFVYGDQNNATFVGKYVPNPNTSGTDSTNFRWDCAHLPNLVSYYAYQLSNDPYHLLLTQFMGAAAIGATKNTGQARGSDGRTNLIVDGEERGVWWGMKAVAEAWKVTPSSTMPKPFLNKSFFSTAIDNSVARIRTNFIGVSGTYDAKIMDFWGALQTLSTTNSVTSTVYKGVHPLSMDYGNFSLCHIMRMGYTGLSDVVQWHAKNAKWRAQAGGNYFEDDTNDNKVALVVGPDTATGLPYTDAVEWVAWHPSPNKHTGTLTYNEWAISLSDGGNYTFQFLNALACYKHLVNEGLITLDWNPSTEYTALVSRLTGPGGATPVQPWIKHYYNF